MTIFTQADIVDLVECLGREAFLAAATLGDRIDLVNRVAGRRLESLHAAYIWIQYLSTLPPATDAAVFRGLAKELILLAPYAEQSEVLFDTLTNGIERLVPANSPVFMITSCRKYLPKAQALRAQLLGRGALAWIITGDANLSQARWHEEGCVLPVADTYEALPQKVIRGVETMVERYGPCTIVKIDDDCRPDDSFNLDLFSELCQRHDYVGVAGMSMHHDRLWHHGKTTQPIGVYARRHHGPWANGPCYVLSTRATRLIAKEAMFFPGEFCGEHYEDKAIGDFLGRHGIQIYRLASFDAMGIDVSFEERLVHRIDDQVSVPTPQPVSGVTSTSTDFMSGVCEPGASGRTTLQARSSPDVSCGVREDAEWRAHSQNGEDGVIQYLFGVIGAGERQFVEIGCEDGSECNSRFLRESGWTGWMFDAVHENQSINLIRAHATRENVVGLLERQGVPKHFDLLSLDIDFNDFHVLDAVLSSFNPRVVVVEYNASHGPDDDAVVPYRPLGQWDGTRWFGASLSALCRLAEVHGYAPVYCESMGVNLFLVKQAEWADRLVPARQTLFRAARYGGTGNGHPEDTHKRTFLTSAHYLLKGASRAFTRFGQISYLKADEYIGGAFAQGRFWEESEVTRIAELLGDASGVAVDAGAHVGSHTVALATMCPNLSFICFEPQSVLRQLLERNVAENGLDSRVTVSPKALAHDAVTLSLAATFSDGSSKNGPIDYAGERPANFGGVQIGAGGEPIAAIALDMLGHQANIVYLKLDVEGAEHLALYGARKILARLRPVLLFESRADRQLPNSVLDSLSLPTGVREFDVMSFLDGLGYRVSKLGQDLLAVASADGSIPMPQAAVGHDRATVAIDIETDVPSETGLYMPDADLMPTAQCIDGIPRVLFQTWKTRRGLPTEFENCRNSFLTTNPGIVAPLWDDADNRFFLQRNFPWFLPIYDAYPMEIYRADAVRYFFLYAFGGVYADLDVVCLKSLDGLIGHKGVVLGRMGADATFKHSLPNAVMASSPRHPFWLLVIAKMIEAQGADSAARPETLTGPAMLKSAFDEFNDQQPRASMLAATIGRRLPPGLQPAPMEPVFVLESTDWFPFNWADPIHQLYRKDLRTRALSLDEQECRKLFPNASMVTFWSHSWETESLAA